MEHKNCRRCGENTEKSKGRNGGNNSMEQRVWRKGLAVGCELREVASRRADGSRHVIVSALVASCNSERHVLMVCLKPRDRKKWAMFPRIITDSKGNRNLPPLTCARLSGVKFSAYSLDLPLAIVTLPYVARSKSLPSKRTPLNRRKQIDSATYVYNGTIQVHAK